MTLPLIGSTTMKPLLPALLLGLAGFSTQAAELRFVEQDAPAESPPLARTAARRHPE